MLKGRGGSEDVIVEVVEVWLTIKLKGIFLSLNGLKWFREDL